MKTNRSTSPFKRLIAMTAVAGLALLTGCANMYVDTASKEVSIAEFKKVAQPKPVQLAFEFQTNGAPNTAATSFLKDSVALQIRESGLFSADTAAAGSPVALMTIKLNNVPITKNAAAQGFVTGLTFGLAGSAVTDGYECTLSYLPPGQATPIVTTARHAIHTTLGNASAPAGAGKPLDPQTAIRTMTRDVVSIALRDLALNPSFN